MMRRSTTRMRRAKKTMPKHWSNRGAAVNSLSEQEAIASHLGPYSRSEQGYRLHKTYKIRRVVQEGGRAKGCYKISEGRTQERSLLVYKRRQGETSQEEIKR